MLSQINTANSTSPERFRPKPNKFYAPYCPLWTNHPASGPGSPENETSIFGTHTYQGLLKFQVAHNLPATGYLGPFTRSALAGDRSPEKWSDLKYVFWHQGGPICRGRSTTPEEIVAKLRQVDVLVSQGHAIADAVR